MLLGGKGERISWTERCHMSLLTVRIELPSSIKELLGEKVPVRDVPKSQWCGEREHRRLRSVWGQMPKPEKGGMSTPWQLKGKLMWLHSSAGFTADINSSMNFHGIYSGFTQAGAVFLGQEVLVSRSTGEQCQGSSVLIQTEKAPALRWEGLSRSSEFLLPSWLLVLVSGSFGLSFI